MDKRQQFLDYIKDTSSVLIISSDPLDADCLGSGLIVKKYLQSLGKKVSLRFPHSLSQEDKNYYDVLPFFNEVEAKDIREILSRKNFDLLILVDGNNLIQFFDSYRPGEAPNLEIYDKRVHFDHHINNPETLAPFTIKRSKASSTAELIIENIIPKDFINQDIATLAYAAIVGDTGNFSWNSSPSTLRLTAFLVEKGAQVDKIIDRFFSSKTKSYLQMLAFAINNIEYSDETGTIFLLLPLAKQKKDHLNEKMISDLKAAFKDELAKSVRGYARGIILYEKEANKVSINGRGNNFTNQINLPELFKKLGANGGGHFHAAGGEIKGDFNEVKERVIAAINQEVKRN